MFLSRNGARGALMLGMLVAGASVASAGSVAPAGTGARLSSAEAKQKMATRALRFIENVGQWNGQARFVYRSEGLNYWVTSRGLTLDYQGARGAYAGHAIGVEFPGGQKPTVSGVGSQSIVTDFIERDGGSRRAGSYAEVWSRGIYPGVDLRSYFDAGQARYDVVVNPGADASKVRMAFRTAQGVSVSPSGDLVVKTVVGEKRQVGLKAYQTVNGQKVDVPVAFEKVGRDTIKFRLGRYDRTKTLVVDPLIYGSYYGGDGGPDEVHAVVADTDGGVYMTGRTRAARFPAIYGPYGFNLAGEFDAFVTKLQGDAYSHDYAAFVGGALNDSGDRIQLDPFGNVFFAGRTESSNFPGNTRANVFFLNPGDGIGGEFRLAYGNDVTPYLSADTTAAQLDDALEDLPSVGDGGVRVTAQPSTGTLASGARFRVELLNRLPLRLQVDNEFVQGFITVEKYTDLFVIRFARSGNLLNPLPTRSLIFGGEGSELMTGFSILQVDEPQTGTPVQIAFSGQSPARIPDIPGDRTSSSFYARYTYSDSARYQRDDRSTKYFPDALNTRIGGSVLDDEGSLYITGDVVGSGNVDTVANPSAFRTTGGVFEGGRLIRNRDLFVRKYSAEGTLLYSAVIGGNGDESAGGLDVDPFGFQNSYGSTIAVDDLGNAYVTGISGSFNYPRTRGVYGEVFTSSANVVVTKINSDASAYVFSTNLRTSGTVRPSGIAVDSAGNVFVAGTAHPFAIFPEDRGQQPGNPNEPVETGIANVNLTGDAIDPTWEIPPSPESPTNEGFINVLNATGTTLVYGSYLGGILDEMLYGPYVDQFGDVWLNGWTDGFRRYLRFPVNSTSAPKDYPRTASLPGTVINTLAFKSTPDQATNGTLFGQAQYGTLDPFGVPVDSSETPFTPVPTVGQIVQRDGFVIRQRINFPGVQSLTVDPSTVAGGQGQVTTATLTLTSPAPAGGADVVFTLDDGTAASFSPTDTQTSLQVQIPAGQTTVSVPIYTRPVSLNTPVQVRATYLGSFKIAQFVVVPYLQQLSITPSEVVGGNEATGRITLAAPAPEGGLVVTLRTDSPEIIRFLDANGEPTTTTTIQAGQTTGTFRIDTVGVTTNRFPTITASVDGAGRTQTLTVVPARLRAITFEPTRVAGGTQARGILSLNGEAGANFQVRIRLNDGTNGYRLRATQTGEQFTTLVLTVPRGATSVSFYVDTQYESVDTQRIATAVRLNSSGGVTSEQVSGTLFVDAVNLTSFTVTPGEVQGGQSAVGTITIDEAAPQGGVVIRLRSSKPNIASVPETVVIPAGQSQVTFEIETNVLFGTDQSVVFRATRGPVSRTATLLVTGSSFTITIDPSTVVGGSQNANGTVTLEQEAPAGGVTVALTSSNPAAASVPATVTIPEGDTSVSFPITTRVVGADVDVTITGRIGQTTATANLSVRTVSLINFTVNPSTLRAFQNAVATATLEAPAPSGGIGVTITLDEDVFTVFGAQRTGTDTYRLIIPAGQRSGSFTLQAKRFSVPFSTTVTASAGSGSRSVVVNIRR